LRKLTSSKSSFSDLKITKLGKKGQNDPSGYDLNAEELEIFMLEGITPPNVDSYLSTSEMNENHGQTVSDFDGKINNKSTQPNFLDGVRVEEDKIELKVKTSSLN
jgi:hypothetical protein